MDGQGMARSIEVCDREDCPDAGRCQSGRGVQAGDAAACDRAAQKTDVQATGRLEVVGELGGATQQTAIFEPPQALPERAGLSHRVKR